MTRRRWAAVAVAVLGVGLIALAQFIPNRHRIEEDLTRRSVAALEAAGVADAQVTFTGRDGAIVLSAASDVDRARDIVASLEGVRVVSAAGMVAAPEITVTIGADGIVIAGTVKDEAARREILAAFAGASEQLKLDASVGDLRDGKMTLTGVVASDALRDAAATAAGEIVGPGNVVEALTVVPPPEVVQRELTELPQITFENNSATLTAEGQAAVAQAAEILRANPGANVRIEGHTDSSGTAESNLELSRARARTVLDALVALGIPATRLSSEGFGETRPRVPDTSPQNQALNRRVEFVVVS